MNNTHAIILIAIMAAVTLLLRILPFFIFGERKTPPYISFLGKYLPFAVMGMLVVYCLKDVSFLKAGLWIPQAISVIFVAMLHIWKRNTLLSVISGTVCYMILIKLF